MLLLLLLVPSVAASLLTLRGMLALKRAHDCAGTGDVPAGQAALRTARRSVWPGLLVLAISIPASLFAVGAHAGVARAHVVLVLTIPVAVMAAFGLAALIVDLRLQDRLRPTPAASVASGPVEAITFELTADHLWRSQMQWQTRSTVGRITLVVALAAMLGLLVGFPLLMHSTHPQQPLIVDFIPSILLLIVFPLLIALFGKRYVVAVSGGHPGVLCEHTLEIRPDGLREKTDVNDTLWPWQELREVIETREYVLLRVSSIGLFAIPTSAFPSDEQRRRFVTEIRGRMSAPCAAVPTPA